MLDCRKKSGFECFADDGSELAEKYNKLFVKTWSQYAFNLAMSEKNIF